MGEITLEQARAEAWDMIHAMRKGVDPKAKKPPKPAELTLQGALDTYLKEGDDRLAAATATSYKLSVKEYLTDWREMPLRAITSEMVMERHRAIAAEVAARRRAKAEASSKRDKSIKPDSTATYFTGKSTANSTMRTLRVLWTFARGRDPSLPENPVLRLKSEKKWFKETRRETLVEEEDLPKFYKAVCALENDIARDYILLILFTGLRRAEAASLTWDDISFERRSFRIPAERTKSGKTLELPLTDFVYNLLAARAAKREPDIPFVFTANSASGYISEPRFALEIVAKDCGVDIGIHDLRRTYITCAEAADLSEKSMKALVNHSLGSDVTEGYIQIRVRRLREPAQRVADRMAQLCGIVAAPVADAASVQVEASA